MHRDVVTHAVVAADVDFLITGSADGHIKFWKKRATGIEFAKHFRAHLGPVKGKGLVPVSCSGRTHCKEPVYVMGSSSPEADGSWCRAFCEP